ncbi:uncharacterized protein LOC131947738 [Physella acuta]|uniref:uncharacterized protein LOC131947738 n=1 Tax=Physella acuta TaxID=109671 RepID=UPI0027DC10A0|nr:uncharacterized protein LOC131947738 [Physella acuta]
MNITRHLVQLTDLVLESNHTPVPGDILGAASLLQDITESLDNVPDIQLDKALDFMQDFIAVVDNIVDPKTVDILDNARTDLVENMASKVIQATQNFVVKVHRKCPDLARQLSSPAPYMDDKIIYSRTARNLDIVISVPSDRDVIQSTSLSSSIEVPRENLVTSGVLCVYVARFFSINKIFSLTETRDEIKPKNKNTVASDVLTFHVIEGGSQKREFRKHQAGDSFQRPIVLTFSLPGNLDTDHEESLTYISYIGATLSIIACLVLIGTIIHFRL